MFVRCEVLGRSILGVLKCLVFKSFGRGSELCCRLNVAAQSDSLARASFFGVGGVSLSVSLKAEGVELAQVHLFEVDHWA